MQAKMHPPLIVCEHCDAVHRKPLLTRGELSRCTCCLGPLERAQRLDVSGMLALTIAALIVFVVANVYPIARIDVRGANDAATLWGCIMTSWREHSSVVSALSALTLFFFPLAELISALVVLGPLAQGRRGALFAVGMRVLRFARNWSMPEVFMLGVIVAMVKLGDIATIHPGLGLWAFAVLTVLITLITSFDHAWLWDIAAERDR
jgi:paraquat-inducible protein A